MVKEATIYFDYAAATPMDDRVLATMQPYLKGYFYNPSAIYLAAVEVKKALEAARATVAEILGARSPEVIFTAGGTEANNLALTGVMKAFPGAHAVTASLEHESVRAPLASLARLGMHFQGIE